MLPLFYLRLKSRLTMQSPPTRTNKFSPRRLALSVAEGRTLHHEQRLETAEFNSQTKCLPLSMPSHDPPAAIAIQQLCQADLSLIQRIVERDRSALAELYDRYAGIIYSVAYHSLDSVVESEQIAIEVFTKIWQTADLYDSDKVRVDTWIFMMTRTLVLDRIRTKQPADKSTIASPRFSNGEATPTIAVFDDLPTATVDVRADLGILARRTQVLTTLANLSIEQRQILALAYYRGWSHREIAEQTGIALKTVTICIWLSLERLRFLHPHNSPIN